MNIPTFHLISTFLCLMSLVHMHDAAVSTLCVDTTSSSPTVPLQCGDNLLIHVISQTYANKTLQGSCPDTVNSCTSFQQSDENDLIVNCNGKEQQCAENVEKPPSCESGGGFKIAFECIKGSKNICSPVDTESVNGSLYLNSPGYPDRDEFNASCNCRINGTMMNVTVLEHLADEGVVTISTDKTSIWSSNSTHYNRIIASRVASVVINYEAYGEKGKVWISIIGAGTLHVHCEHGTTSHITADPFVDSTSSLPIETTSTRNTDNGTTESDMDLFVDSSSSLPIETTSTRNTDNGTTESDIKELFVDSTSSLPIKTTSTRNTDNGTTESDITGNTPLSTFNHTTTQTTSVNPNTSLTSIYTSAQTTTSVNTKTPDPDTSVPVILIAVLGAFCGFLLGLIIAVAACLGRCKRKVHTVVIDARTREEETSLKPEGNIGHSSSIRDISFFELNPSDVNRQAVGAGVPPELTSSVKSTNSVVLPKVSLLTNHNRLEGNKTDSQFYQDVDPLGVDMVGNISHGTSRHDKAEEQRTDETDHVNETGYICRNDNSGSIRNGTNQSHMKDNILYASEYVENCLNEDFDGPYEEIKVTHTNLSSPAAEQQDRKNGTGDTKPYDESYKSTQLRNENVSCKSAQEQGALRSYKGRGGAQGKEILLQELGFPSRLETQDEQNTNRVFCTDVERGQMFANTESVTMRTIDLQDQTFSSESKIANLYAKVVPRSSRILVSEDSTQIVQINQGHFDKTQKSGETSQENQFAEGTVGPPQHSQSMLGFHSSHENDSRKPSQAESEIFVADCDGSNHDNLSKEPHTDHEEDASFGKHESDRNLYDFTDGAIGPCTGNQSSQDGELSGGEEKPVMGISSEGDGHHKNIVTEGAQMFAGGHYEDVTADDLLFDSETSDSTQSIYEKISIFNMLN